MIELLVVVVVIGILAAIAVPRFDGTKEKAFDASARADLRNAMSAEEAYFADNQRYGAMANLSFTTSSGVQIGGGGSAKGYFLSAKHVSSSNTYHVHPGTGSFDDERIHLQ